MCTRPQPSHVISDTALLRSCSPVEINGDINAVSGGATTFGDLFWDSINGAGYTLYNWQALWGQGQLTPTTSARADLKNIATTFGANAIRACHL